jgi:hypothetical protein
MERQFGTDFTRFFTTNIVVIDPYGTVNHDPSDDPGAQATKIGSSTPYYRHSKPS